MKVFLRLWKLQIDFSYSDCFIFRQFLDRAYKCNQHLSWKKIFSYRCGCPSWPLYTYSLGKRHLRWKDGAISVTFAENLGVKWRSQRGNDLGCKRSLMKDLFGHVFAEVVVLRQVSESKVNLRGRRERQNSATLNTKQWSRAFKKGHNSEYIQ